MSENSFMRGRARFLLFVLALSIISLSVVEAQQPQPSQTLINLDVGIEITVPPIEVIKQNAPFSFHFHAFNKTTGLHLTDDTTNCTFHLYNATGNHISKQNATWDAPTDFEVEITSGVLNKPGMYSYIVQCVSSDGTGGFTTFAFEVTPTGFSDTFGFFILILGISAVIIFFGVWIKDPWVVMLGTIGLYFVGIYILLNGIVGIRDLVTTRAIAFVVIGLAAIISIKAGLEAIEG